MKKKYIALVVVFSFLLLLPFTVQSVVDIRGEKRFRSLDIFKDLVYQPFVREKALNSHAQNLKAHWAVVVKGVKEGREADAETLEPVVSAISDLENAALAVNSYLNLDTCEWDYKILKKVDTLVSALEDDAEIIQQVSLAVDSVTNYFEHFSPMRIFYSIKHYGIWTSRYLRAFENKVENENALVLATRPIYQAAVWNIFRDPGEKVVVGSSDWLFYRQDVDFLVQPSPFDIRSAKLDNPVEAIKKFRGQLAQKGVELLVVIVPGKPSIYSEKLVGQDLKAGIHSHGKRVLDTLSSLGFNTVDLYTPLLKARENTSSPLYLRDDTHWTPLGAELAAKVIADKVKSMAQNNPNLDLGEPSMEYSTADSVALRLGDIGEMSGLKVFDTEKVVGHVVQDSSGVPFKDDFRKSKILILGDSFSRIYQTDAPVNAGWIAHFAKEVKRPVSSIVSDGGASTLVREKLARKGSVLKGKKLLIWEFVERDLRFGDQGWKDVRF
ncbi:MAG: hypothetical protein HUK21_10905 [Fibrobacteraceae bacterium]|nr:hypothetical protein [Fibrobacteraceae bacterium]